MPTVGEHDAAQLAEVSAAVEFEKAARDALRHRGKVPCEELVALRGQVDVWIEIVCGEVKP